MNRYVDIVLPLLFLNFMIAVVTQIFVLPDSSWHMRCENYPVHPGSMKSPDEIPVRKSTPR